MYKLRVENALGETYDLTNSKDEFYILDVQGLTVPKIEVNTKESAGIDGSFYSSSKVGERNIVINIMLNGDIEASRQKLYRIFLIKHELTLYFTNKYRALKIKGYPESIDGDLFVQQEQIQVSIICPRPFFESTEQVTMEPPNIIDGFEFPFSIPSEGIEFSWIQRLTTIYTNSGDVETGAIIKFYAADNRVSNPIFYNRTTGKYFGLIFDMYENDVIIINTREGEKSVTLLRNGSTTNILSKRKKGSSWIVFAPGENETNYSADTGEEHLSVTVTAVQKYVGV